MRGLLAVTLVLALVGPPSSLASEPVPPLPLLDCALVPYAISPGPRLNSIVFEYYRSGVPDFMQISDLEVLKLPARTWSNQINNCGLIDNTSVSFHVSPGPNTPAFDNGKSEIWWDTAPQEPTVPARVYVFDVRPGLNIKSCDIVLVRDYWQQLHAGANIGNVHHLLLASVVAQMMGHCLGLAETPSADLGLMGGSAYQTMGGGSCYPPQVVIPSASSKFCGLTLGASDVAALQQLWLS